jgi:hypothetical protein
MSAELTVSQINGRFQILERPSALPGKCAVCGAVDKPVIDFGFDLDYYGAVYFCVECIIEAASLLGMVKGELLETAQLVQQNHNDQLIEAGAAVDDFVNRVSSLYNDFTAHLNGTSPSVSTETPEVPDESDEGVSTVDGDEQQESPEPTTQDTEPTSKRGRSRVSSRSSNGSEQSGVFKF